MVILATKAGFSSALGAFVMGSILAETMDAERIEHLVQPVKNLFGAIFFVSVGMMINIPVLGDHLVSIVIISLVVIIGQVFFASSGVLLAGQPLKVAMKSGFSLAQIGEFSFIIAGLGLTLGVIANYVYPVIVAVSTITIFTTPYMIRLSEPTYRFIERNVPASWHKFFNEKNTSGAHPVNYESTWKLLLKGMVKMVVIYLLISIMILFLSFQYFVPFIHSHIHGILGNVVITVVVLSVLSPFMRAIMVKKNHSAEFEQLWSESRSNRGPLIFTIVFRVLLCMGMIVFVLEELFHAAWGIAAGIAIIVLIIFVFSKQLKKQSILIERRFKKNLNARQHYHELHAPIKKGFVNHLMARDLHLADFEVKQNYSIIGKTLKELNFRQRCGVNIVTIIRGDKRINVPGGDELLMPFDHIIILGTDRQMLVFQRFIEEKRTKYAQKKEEEPIPAPQVSIEQFQIEWNSSLIGKTIKTSEIRDRGDCLVVGIERDNTSVMNPDIDLELFEGDIIWVVGEHDKIVHLKDL
jgi:CPA2 family monovalent cation:H+ antiporter-2